MATPLDRDAPVAGVHLVEAALVAEGDLRRPHVLAPDGGHVVGAVAPGESVRQAAPRAGGGDVHRRRHLTGGEHPEGRHAPPDHRCPLVGRRRVHGVLGDRRAHRHGEGEEPLGQGVGDTAVKRTHDRPALVGGGAVLADLAPALPGVEDEARHDEARAGGAAPVGLDIGERRRVRLVQVAQDVLEHARGGSVQGLYEPGDPRLRRAHVPVDPRLRAGVEGVHRRVERVRHPVHELALCGVTETGELGLERLPAPRVVRVVGVPEEEALQPGHDGRRGAHVADAGLPAELVEDPVVGPEAAGHERHHRTQGAVGRRDFEARHGRLDDGHDEMHRHAPAGRDDRDDVRRVPHEARTGHGLPESRLQVLVQTLGPLVREVGPQERIHAQHPLVDELTDVVHAHVARTHAVVDGVKTPDRLGEGEVLGQGGDVGGDHLVVAAQISEEAVEALGVVVGGEVDPPVPPRGRSEERVVEVVPEGSLGEEDAPSQARDRVSGGIDGGGLLGVVTATGWPLGLLPDPQRDVAPQGPVRRRPFALGAEAVDGPHPGPEVPRRLEGDDVLCGDPGGVPRPREGQPAAALGRGDLPGVVHGVHLPVAVEVPLHTTDLATGPPGEGVRVPHPGLQADVGAGGEPLLRGPVEAEPVDVPARLPLGDLDLRRAVPHVQRGVAAPEAHADPLPPTVVGAAAVGVLRVVVREPYPGLIGPLGVGVVDLDFTCGLRVQGRLGVRGPVALEVPLHGHDPPPSGLVRVPEARPQRHRSVRRHVRSTFDEAAPE